MAGPTRYRELAEPRPTLYLPAGQFIDAADMLVLGEGLRLAGLGAMIGLAGAMLTARLLRGLLFGVQPLDPLSLLAAAVLLVGVSALASGIPARRAARVDPVSLLRAE